MSVGTDESFSSAAMQQTWLFCGHSCTAYEITMFYYFKTYIYVHLTMHVTI